MEQHTHRVEDRKAILDQKDHMRDMQRTTLDVTGISSPYPSIARVTGRVDTSDPQQWTVPNLAVRIEVDDLAAARPLSRIYTIRHFDPTRREVEIDVVLHDDDSPAMRWLRDLRVGDRVWMTGPRTHFVPPFTPGKRAALFADDTAIPAVFSILRAWPQGVPGAIWVEGCDRAAMDALPRVPGVARHFMLRDAAMAAGTTGRLFAAAASAITSPQDWTIWAAGERSEMRLLRTHFRKLGLPPAALQVTGYWKHGMCSTELDRQRLAAYEAARAEGLTLEDMMDRDEAV